MAKRLHEVRDAVHGFVAFDDDERFVIDSAPFQRLRHIHQLALTYNVYPGASHTRFEHSLGVMHLAGRIFDVITRADKISDTVRDALPTPGSTEHGYWRTVVRMAALCHDTGHLPFSHAAEDELLPDGVDHERITWDIVHSEEMTEIFARITPPVRADDVGKLAVGPRKAERLGLDVSFDPWEALLAEVIVGDSFGADRMDYLLRDSLHTGVQYGRFDHERLIGTLRVIPDVPRDEDEEGGSTEPVLGVERGGLQSAEQLLLARYFMFAQVYHHPTRLAYNEHLKDFLKAWLPDGVFPVDVVGHLERDDDDVLVAIKQAAADEGRPGHGPAKRIIGRDHFKVAYERAAAQPGDHGPFNGDTEQDVRWLARAAAEHFGAQLVTFGAPPSRKAPPDFAVFSRDGSVTEPASGLSEVYNRLPQSPDAFVLADGQVRAEVNRWISTNRESIIAREREAAIEQAERDQP